MANTNQYLGLARGPIDHQASSVINAIANEALDMGDAVILTGAPSGELLPRVKKSDTEAGIFYGIVVGGDADGIYGDGSASTDDSTRASTGAGQGVVVCTQGRCLAKVEADTTIGVLDALTTSSTDGTIKEADATSDKVGARALQPVTSGDTDMIAVDVQREAEK